MDPTTVPPPSPENPPPPPPQNPHTPTVTIEASAFDCYPKDEPSTNGNMDNFKALMSKLAGRLLPAHQSHIERRLNAIFPDELLIPNHPPYADMILTALWELNTEGGSSEEAISDFISTEYHDLPWAHATILNHHLKDLCTKGKIVMTRDKHYLRCLSTPKPIPSQPNLNDSSSSSPISSPSSSSSESHWSSPTSSSSSMGWDTHKKRKRKKKTKRRKVKGRGVKMAHVRGRGRVRDRGRGRETPMIQVTLDQNEVMGMEAEEDDGGEKQEENNNEVMGMEAEEDDGGEKQQENNNEVMEKGFLVESQTEVMSSQKVDEERKGDMVGLRRSGRRRNGASEEHKVGAKEEYHQQKQYNLDAEVIELEDDVINDDGDEVDEHVECSKQEVEEVAKNVENKEEETEVIQEPIHPQGESAEMTDEKLDSCSQDLLKNESTEEECQHEEQETEVNQKESEDVVMESDEQIEPQVENEVTEKDTEEQVELLNLETVTSTPIKEIIKVVLGLMAVKSGSQIVEEIQPQNLLKEGTEEVVEKVEKMQLSREGLRSSLKKQEPTPIPKKKLEHVTPVRRSLRSNKTTDEAAVINEGPDHSKEQVELTVRTRSSKRKAEQVSKSKKIRRN